MDGPDLYLATCADLPNGDPDTERLAAHLRAIGLSVCVATWDDPAVQWSTARLTVIRSTWDYATRRADFLEWTRSVPSLRNTATLVEWNTDKRYLLDLPATVEVVPSQVLQNPTVATLEACLDGMGWEEGVLKPTVGLDGYGVSRVRKGEVDPVDRDGTWLLQPFVAEAAVEGEISVVMIDGRPTHAVRRVPPPDDFRAQERLGGRVEACDPHDDILELASAATLWIEPRPLYARVDIVRRGGVPCLMELELVEPSLFFEHGPAGLLAMSDIVTDLVGST